MVFTFPDKRFRQAPQRFRSTGSVSARAQSGDFLTLDFPFLADTLLYS
jgi:hypothetical protein